MVQPLRQILNQVTTGFCLSALVLNGSAVTPFDDACGAPTLLLAENATHRPIKRVAPPVAPPIRLMKANRKVPEVAAPKVEMEFSASPTIQELFRVRVFEDPLVPVGGKPGSAENKALASALLGYAKRRRPDPKTDLRKFPR